MTSRLLLPFCLAAVLAGCGTAVGDTEAPADTADGGGGGADTAADTADTADTGADTADTAIDTGGETGDTADTALDTGPKIEPLHLEVTNDLTEAIDFLDAADFVSGDYKVLVDDASPMAPGEVRDFLLAEGTWSFYAETPTTQCGSVANVMLSPTTAGYAWDIASLIDCSE